MPCDYKKYPPTWKTEIRPRILARAKDRCENCGAENYKPHPVTGSRVILTIMHLDHDPQNWAVKDDRLFSACQRCHLFFDRVGYFPEVTKKIKKCTSCNESYARSSGVVYCAIYQRPGYEQNPKFNCQDWREVKDETMGKCKCGQETDYRRAREPICERCRKLEGVSCGKKR